MSKTWRDPTPAPGTRVRITQDCREDMNATGMFGTYTGNVPVAGLPMPNPRIELDNGNVIFGCECWWEPITDDMPDMETATAILEEYKTLMRKAIGADE